jgi:hypothetical protein
MFQLTITHNNEHHVTVDIGHMEYIHIMNYLINNAPYDLQTKVSLPNCLEKKDIGDDFVPSPYEK